MRVAVSFDENGNIVTMLTLTSLAVEPRLQHTIRQKVRIIIYSKCPVE